MQFTTAFLQHFNFFYVMVIQQIIVVIRHNAAMYMPISQKRIKRIGLYFHKLLCKILFLWHTDISEGLNQCAFIYSPVYHYLGQNFHNSYIFHCRRMLN
jgi:hypothetical protein